LKKSWNAGENGNTDKLYWLKAMTYEKLDGGSWSAIESGKAKL